MEPEDRASPAARRRARRRRATLGGLAVLLTGAVAWVVASASCDDATLDQPSVQGGREAESREAELPAPVEALAAVRTETPAKVDAGKAMDEAPTRDPRAKERSLLLHVLARSTGEELHGCEAWIGKGAGLRFGPGEPVDTSANTLLGRGDSPLRLVAPPDSRALSELLVDAPGCVQTKLQVDWSSGGERTIELDAEAGLTLIVTGAPASTDLAARLHDAARREAQVEQILRGQQRDRSGDPRRNANWHQQTLDELAALRRRPIGPELDRNLLRGLSIRGPDRYVPLDAEARATVAELAAGRWIVEITTGDAPRASTHALGEVVLRAGESATLELAWREVAPRPHVQVEGRIVFDRGWLEPGMPELPDRLHVSTLDPEELDPLSFEGPNVALVATDRVDVRRFVVRELLPGPALASLRDWRWSTSFTVPEEGSDAIEIVVPPPARVIVHGRERGAPDIPVPTDVNWRAFDTAEAAGGDWSFHGSRSEGDRALELVVPQGELSLWAGAAKHDFKTESIHRIGQAFEEITLEFRDCVRVEVTLRDGTAAVPLFQHAFASLWLEAGGRALPRFGGTFSGASSAVTLFLDGEGPALLHLDPCEGYVMVAPAPVELKRGETIAVDLPVRRARR